MKCEHCLLYLKKQSMHNEIICRNCQDRISLNQAVIYLFLKNIILFLNY